MIYIILTLAGSSITLFILSFFMNDRFKQIDEQLEQISISSIQEIYQLKKKIKILEEELLAEDLNMGTSPFAVKEKQASVTERIKAMYGNGMSPGQISHEFSIPEQEIRSLLLREMNASQGVRP